MKGMRYRRDTQCLDRGLTALKYMQLPLNFQKIAEMILVGSTKL